MNWTDSQISGLAKEGENYVASRLDLIIDRIAINTTPGQSEVQIPAYVTDITQVTYKGFKVDPANFQEMVNSGTGPSSISAGSRPLYYSYTGFGTQVIKFFPAIGESLVIPIGSLFNTAQISTCLIIEFYRSPDFNSLNNRVPAYIRKPLIKQYVLYRALQQEGPGQYLQGSDFFKNMFDAFLKVLKSINNTAFMSREYISQGSPNTARNRPARPILPPNYPRSY